MNQQQVDSVRNAAILLEDVNLLLAHDLMALALEYRPSGLFIGEKLETYKAKLAPQFKVKNLLQSGKLALIPAGFRCHTKQHLAESLGVEQASLPFDSGFFSPHSVASILRNKEIRLSYSQGDDKTHSVCIKSEHFLDERLGRGIEFRRSSYEELSSLVASRQQEDISKYLDSTFGYYTLDERNMFVLAHYNWHKFSAKENNNGIIDPKINVPNINGLLNRRLKRMFDLCEVAEYVVFVVGEFQEYEFITIDEETFNLSDLGSLNDAAREVIGGKCVVAKYSEIDTAIKLLKTIGVPD